MGIYFSVDKTPDGRLQLSINDENGGYRLAGPKYDGRSKSVMRHEPTLRDIEEIETYLRSAKTTLTANQGQRE